MRAICAALSALVFFVFLQSLDREVTIAPPTTHETTVSPTQQER